MARLSKAKITLATIKNLAVGASVSDSEVKGFMARRQTDRVTYSVRTRINGVQRRFTIGKHGSPWTVDTARDQARKLLKDAADGVDATEAKRERSQARPSFDLVADAFIVSHGPKLKPKTLAVYEIIIRNHLKPKFGKLAVADIRHVHISDAHASWAATPRSANHALAVMSKMMNWAEDNEYREPDTNPCRRIKHYREQKRERYLSREELERLGDVLARGELEGRFNPYIIAVVRLLLLTGARRNEWLEAKWDYVDFTRRTLNLPDSKTGQKSILLNDAAISVLRDLPRIEGNPYVFPGHNAGKHLTNISKTWHLIRSEAKIGDLHLHDLRHSFAAFAVDEGASLPVIGKLLGHSQPQTTARYAHVAPSPAQQLSSAIGQRLGAVVLQKKQLGQKENPND